MITENVSPRFRGAGKKQITELFACNRTVSNDLTFSVFLEEIDLSTYIECPESCLRCSLEDVIRESRHNGGGDNDHPF
jgi:hypothetical protein